MKFKDREVSGNVQDRRGWNKVAPVSAQLPAGFTLPISKAGDMAAKNNAKAIQDVWRRGGTRTGGGF